MTNYLELPRPRDDRLPYMCHLNFTAAGGIHGDLVQVSNLKCRFDSYLMKIPFLTSKITVDGFHVGKFCSYVTEGCPDGYMH